MKNKKPSPEILNRMKQIFLSALLPMLILTVVSTARADSRTGKISGFVRDGKTGEPVKYADVLVEGTVMGALSGANGYYLILGVAPGVYTLRSSRVGYTDHVFELTVRAGGVLRRDFSLEPAEITLDGTVVTAERTRFDEQVEVSSIIIDTEEIESVPSFIETDVFRSVQSLPSVSPANDFSAALIVRGGSPDENLILLDGIEVYNPYHLGGVFSAFDTDCIADAEFLAGGFPVEYGGRLSSVLKLRSREGNTGTPPLIGKKDGSSPVSLNAATLRVSLLSAKTQAEGVFPGGAWMFSARRTFFDKLAEAAARADTSFGGIPYYFWDAQFSVHSDVTQHDRVSATIYKGRDDLELEFGGDGFDDIDFNWDWGNSVMSARWRRIAGPDFISETILARSEYDFDLDFAVTVTDTLTGIAGSSEVVIENRVADITLTHRSDWYPSDAHAIGLGGSLKFLDFDFTEEVDGLTFLRRTSDPFIASLFLQDTWDASARLSLQYGLRLSRYSDSGRIHLDPRCGFKWKPAEDTAVKGSAGLYSQFLFTANDDEQEILRIVDFWLPVPPYLQPQRAAHFILGVEQWLGKLGSVSLEGYYKPYSNILELNPLNVPEDENDDFIDGTAESYGVELLLRRTAGRLTGWFGYAWSETIRRVDLNGDGRIRESEGEVYNPVHDQRHRINMVLGYDLGERHHFGLAWSFSSGQPYTPVTGTAFGPGGFGNDAPYDGIQEIYGARNSARMPWYRRADLSYALDFKTGGADCVFHAQVINFTNAFNILFYNWDHDSSPSRVEAVGMFPIMPSVGLEVRF